MLVALPSSIAFGVITYSSIGPEYAGIGAMAGMVGAGAMGLAAPIFGRTKGLISAPCAPSAAVLTAFIAALIAGGSGITASEILPLLVLTAIMAGIFQVVYGVIGGGNLIKFIPYPVVSGYLSAVALIIAIGQLPKLFGLPKGTHLFSGLASPELWRWEGIVIGLVTIVLMLTSHRITMRLPSAIIGLIGGVAAYFIIAAFSPALLSLDANALVIGQLKASGSFLSTVGERLSSLFSIKAETIGLIVVPALTLSVLLSIDTLKTCIGLDAITGNRHNSNKELRGQGIANLFSAFTGGMPGAGTMGPTLVNVSSGGRTFMSGLIEGGFVILAAILLGGLIAWVPIASLAGILLVIAYRMFDKGMFRLLKHRTSRFDFAVIAGVIVVALADDLIAASGVGVALAILLFLRDQIKGSVIRRKLYLNQISSKTRRLDAERAVLHRDGEKAVCCELQGNLFFGTTDQLFTQIEPDLKTKLYVIFDMRRVQSMDYTAAHLFELMHARLAKRGGRLILCHMPLALMEERDFEKYLREMGVVKRHTGVKVCDTLDYALEWTEERLLDASGIERKNEETRLKLREFHLFREFEDDIMVDLLKCMTEAEFKSGEKIVSSGDTGDELFLVRKGSVRIMLPLGGAKWHHLATVSQGDFFGELSFIDKNVRSADVVAKTPTNLYVLSRAKFNEKALANPTLGIKVFARLASAAAARLRLTDAELKSLEEG